MSRATALRDAIVEELDELFETHTDPPKIEAFSLLLYEREELKEKPLVLVRVAGREFSANQGPDEQMILVDVIICGAIPKKTGNSVAEYRQQLTANYDTFDSLFETLLGFWVPKGPLSKIGLADHRFSSIEEVRGFEMDELHSDGVYLSWIQVKYQDCLDEGDED